MTGLFFAEAISLPDAATMSLYLTGAVAAVVTGYYTGKAIGVKKLGDAESESIKKKADAQVAAEKLITDAEVEADKKKAAAAAEAYKIKEESEKDSCQKKLREANARIDELTSKMEDVLRRLAIAEARSDKAAQLIYETSMAMLQQQKFFSSPVVPKPGA